jgi:D-glycero-D-manno-heptose 1,7-bisphosphate phosphatase
VGGFRKEIHAAVSEPRQDVSRGRPAVFFDRDGTLNEEVEFLKSPDQLRLIPGAAHAVGKANAAGLQTCVISNQSGVARGFLTEADLLPIHAKLASELSREGARIDAIYYCPHHPTEGIPPYNVVCECRKPRPGMLRRAERELGIDLASSYVIGDRTVDVRAAQAVGGTGILVLTGYGLTAQEECRRDGIVPDHVAPSVAEAMEYVLADRRRHRENLGRAAP